MSNELVVIEETKVIEVFSADNGLDSIIQQAREAVSEFEHDISTAAGRKRTASLANKVAKLKVKLDTMGKESTADLKAKAKLVDGNRKSMRDELDALKVEARKPLTDWEEDQARIEAENKFLAEWDAAIAKNVAFDTAVAHELEVAHMEALLDNIAFDKAADEAKEAERLRIEAEEKARVEREEKMKRHAAEQARLEAERKAKEEADRLIREKQEAEAKAEAQRQAAIQAEIDAENARLEAERQKELAEQQRLDDERRLEQQRKEAAAKAKLEAEQAELRRIEQEKEAKRQAELAEQRRIAEAKAAEEKRLADIEAARQSEIRRQQEEAARVKQEQEQREANKRHVGNIRKQAKEALMANANLTEQQAKDVVLAISKGLIANCQINY